MAYKAGQIVDFNRDMIPLPIPDFRVCINGEAHDFTLIVDSCKQDEREFITRVMCKKCGRVVDTAVTELK